jgi:hypothetical protein
MQTAVAIHPWTLGQGELGYSSKGPYLDRCPGHSSLESNRSMITGTACTWHATGHRRASCFHSQGRRCGNRQEIGDDGRGKRQQEDHTDGITGGDYCGPPNLGSLLEPASSSLPYQKVPTPSSPSRGSTATTRDSAESKTRLRQWASSVDGCVTGGLGQRTYEE